MLNFAGCMEKFYQAIRSVLAVAVLTAALSACNDELHELEPTGSPMLISSGTSLLGGSVTNVALFRHSGFQIWGVNTRGGVFAKGADYSDARFHVENMWPARVGYDDGWNYSPLAEWTADDRLTFMAMSPMDLEQSGFSVFADYADTHRFALTFTGDAMPRGPLLIAPLQQYMYGVPTPDLKFTFEDMLSKMYFRINNDMGVGIDSLLSVGVSGSFPMGGSSSRPRVLVDEQVLQWENLENHHLDFAQQRCTRFDGDSIPDGHSVATLADSPLYFFPGFADSVRFEIRYTQSDTVGTFVRYAALSKVMRMEQGKGYLFEITLVKR